MPLSKSDYMNFLRHPAWLWLKKNDPSKIPPVDPETQQRMKAGYEFEEYAERLFPDAKKSDLMILVSIARCFLGPLQLGQEVLGV